MKVLLVVPSIKSLLWNYGSKFKMTLNPSLSVLYLASVLEKESIDVSILDLSCQSFDNLSKVLKKENPDIVGVSCHTDTRKNALKIARTVKEYNKNIITIFGGFHPTYFPEQILKHREVDYVVRGEGEITLIELIYALTYKTDLSEVSGIAYRKDGRVMITKDREAIKDINKLPIPSYHLLDFDRYCPSGEVLADWVKNGNRYAVMNTTRGCPYNCTYCSVVAFWGKKWRSRSADNVVNEIELLVNKYKVTYITFNDDSFTINKQRVIDICKRIIKKNLKIRWCCATRVDAISPDLLKNMKDAGCINIYFGVESCSDKILKSIRKNIGKEDIIEAFKMCKAAGIRANMGLMVGNQGENKETIKETIEVIKQCNPDSITTVILLLYPNTAVYYDCKAKGLISDDYWINPDNSAIYYTYENTEKQLENFQRQITTAFHVLKKEYFMAVIKLLQSYRFTDNLLEKINYIKRKLGIRSFGIYRFLNRHNERGNCGTKK